MLSICPSLPLQDVLHDEKKIIEKLEFNKERINYWLEFASNHHMEIDRANQKLALFYKIVSLDYKKIPVNTLKSCSTYLKTTLISVILDIVNLVSENLKGNTALYKRQNPRLIKNIDEFINEFVTRSAHIQEQERLNAMVLDNFAVWLTTNKEKQRQTYATIGALICLDALHNFTKLDNKISRNLHPNKSRSEI